MNNSAASCNRKRSDFRGTLIPSHVALACGIGLLWIVVGKTTGRADQTPTATTSNATPSVVYIYPDKANVIEFPAQSARYVRLVIRASSKNEPCVDELEIRGPNGDRNLAASETGAVASASSCLSGYPQHQIAHLNDGQYGNANSWIAATATESWAQIELAKPCDVSQLVFSRDRSGRYSDRVPTDVEVRLSLDGKQWVRVGSLRGTVIAANGGGGTITRYVPPPLPPPSLNGLDSGQAKPIAPVRIAALAAKQSNSKTDPTWTCDTYARQLRRAWDAEEHAWLKTYGYADLSDRLVPYNGRVKEYPHHVPDDLLPLARLNQEPAIDARCDDSAWQRASCGTARVAAPGEFQSGPLVSYTVAAGYLNDDLYVAIRTSRLLSRHIAILSTAGGGELGVVLWEKGSLQWRTYEANGDVREALPVAGAGNKSLTCFEFKIPLQWLPGYREHGIRIGLGMGGRHTSSSGRPVRFLLAPFSVAAISPCRDSIFHVRLTASSTIDSSLVLAGNIGPLEHGLTLAPGQSKVIAIAGNPGPIGPQFPLRVWQPGSGSFNLQFFRYDPLERILTLMDQMLDRFSCSGMDVTREHEQATKLHQAHQLLVKAAPELAAERSTVAAAHSAKRQLFLRAPELISLRRILFVKRHAFEPSHNYSVILDSPYRPGGGIYELNIPRGAGRLDPAGAELTRLFAAGDGIARNPMADFDLTKIYFAYRRSSDDYFHIMAMAPNGTDQQQLTSGPFHDYWPCPLPDQGIAFISTRCRARFLCWRPQAAVLFRMETNGQDIRPLSFANLTEWGPSVMNDGRIIWQRSEYIDKGADFSHTLWAIRPDGTQPELVFGNDIIQPNGYANGREVPGTTEILCTLISHFGDLNGPLALVDPARGRFNPKAITSLTPEVPWPGMWPKNECFRDPVPIARDYFLCSHAPADQFGLYVIDRYGNRELLYLDPRIGSMCPTPFCERTRPPVLPNLVDRNSTEGEFVLEDVYQGLEPSVTRGQVKYLRVCEEVRADLDKMPNGTYRADHPSFQDWYATPTHKISGPFGWPSFVAKASLGIVPVEADGSAHFQAPAGKVLYFEVLDKDLNELQRMRSVVQLQPGERRGCVGCHESRNHVPNLHSIAALKHPARQLDRPPWGAIPLAYQQVVQPVWDAHCVRCHDARDAGGINLTGTIDAEKIPASYRTLISQGWVHYLDYGWNSGGNEKRAPLTFGTLRSKLRRILDENHHDVHLSLDEVRRVKCWIDLNCPLWPDYRFRGDRPGPPLADRAASVIEKNIAGIPTSR